MKALLKMAGVGFMLSVPFYLVVREIPNGPFIPNASYYEILIVETKVFTLGLVLWCLAKLMEI